MTKNGDVRWVEFRGSLVRDADGRVTGVTGVVRDQTLAHVQAALLDVQHDLDRAVLEGENELTLAKRVCDALATAMPYLVVWLSLHGERVDARGGERLDEIDDAELLALGADGETDRVRAIAASDDDRTMAKLASAGGTHVVTVPLRTHGGDPGVLGIAVRSENLEPEHVAAIASFAARFALALRLAAHQALLEHMARHDSLTDLANRSCFEQHLQIGLGRAQSGDERVALLFVDLDRFKLINDTLGHAVGDELLVEVAGRIRRCAREGDLVARFGGDEFSVVLESCDEAEAARVASEILVRIAEPMLIAHHEISITASIGIALATGAITDAETLVKHADVAMYQAKAIGRNAYAFFTSDLAATSARALAIKEGLRRALAGEGELAIHYQPQMSARGELVGVEALLRWTSPELGAVSPAEFVPIAEQSGLITSIDRWVMQAACAQAKRWHDEGLRVPRVSVNVSGVSVRQGSLAATVDNALTTTGLPPDLLEIELTEGIMMHDASNVIATLDAVRALGVRVALDDFGTGYSSLGYLKRFKLDVLKIDRSFVTGLPHDPDSAAIARLIVAMATTLRMETVAEGVETPEQAAFLESIGCRTFQGWLFSRALPAHEIPRLARRTSASARANEAQAA